MPSELLEAASVSVFLYCLQLAIRRLARGTEPEHILGDMLGAASDLCFLGLGISASILVSVSSKLHVRGEQVTTGAIFIVVILVACLYSVVRLRRLQARFTRRRGRAIKWTGRDVVDIFLGWLLGFGALTASIMFGMRVVVIATSGG